MNKDWNPELYLRFNQERTQPAIDLLTRIKVAAPTKLLPYPPPTRCRHSFDALQRSSRRVGSLY